MILTRVLVLGLIALTGVSAGCGKLFGPKTTQAAVELRAAPTLNPDDSGRPSPLRLRLYELKSVSAFNSADFNSLYQHDKDVLGGDLVSVEEIQVQPGMQKKLYAPDRPRHEVPRGPGTLSEDREGGMARKHRSACWENHTRDVGRGNPRGQSDTATEEVIAEVTAE